MRRQGQRAVNPRRPGAARSAGSAVRSACGQQCAPPDGKGAIRDDRRKRARQMRRLRQRRLHPDGRRRRLRLRALLCRTCGRPPAPGGRQRRARSADAAHRLGPTRSRPPATGSAGDAPRSGASPGPRRRSPTAPARRPEVHPHRIEAIGGEPLAHDLVATAGRKAARLTGPALPGIGRPVHPAGGAAHPHPVLEREDVRGPRIARVDRRGECRSRRGARW